MGFPQNKQKHIKLLLGTLQHILLPLKKVGVTYKVVGIGN